MLKIPYLPIANPNLFGAGYRRIDQNSLERRQCEQAFRDFIRFGQSELVLVYQWAQLEYERVVDFFKNRDQSAEINFDRWLFDRLRCGSITLADLEEAWGRDGASRVISELNNCAYYGVTCLFRREKEERDTICQSRESYFWWRAEPKLRAIPQVIQQRDLHIDEIRPHFRPNWE